MYTVKYEVHVTLIQGTLFICVLHKHFMTLKSYNMLGLLHE